MRRKREGWAPAMVFKQGQTFLTPLLIRLGVWVPSLDSGPLVTGWLTVMLYHFRGWGVEDDTCLPGFLGMPKLGTQLHMAEGPTQKS